MREVYAFAPRSSHLDSIEKYVVDNGLLIGRVFQSYPETLEALMQSSDSDTMIVAKLDCLGSDVIEREKIFKDFKRKRLQIIAVAQTMLSGHDATSTLLRQLAGILEGPLAV